MHSQEEDAKHGTRFCRLKEGLVSRQCRRLGMALRQYLAWQSTGFRRCGWRILRIWGIWGIWGMNDSCRLQLQAGTVYSTRLSFLLPSKLTCSEVRCTDNLLPTCCVCHGTQSCRDRNQCYKAILLRPGATSDCKNFAISSSYLGAPQFARQGARGSGIQGGRAASAPSQEPSNLVWACKSQRPIPVSATLLR